MCLVFTVIHFNFFSRLFHVLGLRILNECYNENEALTRALITHDCYADTLRTIKRVPSLNIAAKIGNEEFIAHSSCQYLLNVRWGGRLILEEGRRFKVKDFLQQNDTQFLFCFVFFFFIREVIKVRII